MAESSFCPGCGAMLPLPDLAGLATCPSCGRTTRTDPTPPASRPSGAERDEPTPTTPPGQDPDPPAQPATSWTPDPGADLLATMAAAGNRPLRPPPDHSSRSGPGKGCLVAAFAALLLFVAGVSVIAFSSARDDLRARIDPSYSPYEDLLVLGGTAQVVDLGGEGADVIATVQEVDGGDVTRTLARLRFAGADEPELVWQSAPLDESAHRAQLAVLDDTLFVGLDAEVAALDVATGETRWRAELRDVVTPGCADCFATVGGRLVVRTTDAYLTGFGPASSEQQWTRRLRSPSATVSVAGDHLLVADDPEVDGDPVAVTAVDPATGRDGRATVPSCPPSERWPYELYASPRDEVHAVPDSDDVVSAFGFGDGCAVRWNPADGTIRWQTPLPEVSSFDPDTVVVSGSTMAFASSGAGPVAIDLETGSGRALEAPPDTTATPAAVVDGVLVGDTVASRGSRRGGLAGWDLATGELRWTSPVPGDAEPVERDRYATTVALFDGTPRSVLVPTADGLTIVVFDGGTRTYSTTPITVASGRLGAEVRRDLVTETDLGIPSMGVVGVDGDRLLVTIDSVVESIPTSGGEVVTFPPLR